MPYYQTTRLNKVVTSGSYLISSGAPTYGPYTAHTQGSVDTSFRTIAPTGDEVKMIARNIAEPYSWFMDRQALAIRAFRKDPRFDPSLITEDRGHPWSNRKWNFHGGLTYTQSLTRFENVALARAVVPPAPSGTLESDAALWYGRMAPGVSEFSLSSFTGELREGLPRLIPDLIRRANKAKAAGSDYLNVEFGWKPLLNDLQELAYALYAASLGLYRPLGANHRRREPKPIFNTDTQTLTNSSAATSYGNFTGGLSGLTKDPTAGSTAFDIWGTQTTRIKTRRWFEGEFVYIPKASFDPKKYLDRFETLISLEVTPSVLWNLAPWSWFVDWFADIGGAIASMEAGMTNRVISSYFYGMEEVKSSTHLSLTRMRLRSNGSTAGLPQTYTQFATLETKRRIRGNPFGYSGSSFTALNKQQMDILIALGLTKTR